MSYELFTRGEQSCQDMDVVCPKCGIKNIVKWFPASRQTYRVTGTTGSSSTRTDRKGEKVKGTCKDCSYVFKPKDLD